MHTGLHNNAKTKLECKYIKNIFSWHYGLYCKHNIEQIILLIPMRLEDIKIIFLIKISELIISNMLHMLSLSSYTTFFHVVTKISTNESLLLCFFLFSDHRFSYY